MCGRYASTRSREDLLREFEIESSNTNEQAVEPDNNVAPTKKPPVAGSDLGFYEWFPTQKIGRPGKPLKQRLYLHRNDDGVLALPGLYEFWHNKTKAEDDPDRWLTTFTIITTSATDDVGHIHDRMPMTVAPNNCEAWLEARRQAGPVPATLQRAFEGRMRVGPGCRRHFTCLSAWLVLTADQDQRRLQQPLRRTPSRLPLGRRWELPA